jgi:hypothetical protein
LQPFFEKYGEVDSEALRKKPEYLTDLVSVREQWVLNIKMLVKEHLAQSLAEVEES